MSSCEERLSDHLAQQDRIDETAFCVGCGEIVYLHDRSTYVTSKGGVTCRDCVAEHYTTDAPANDAEVMAFEGWQEQRATSIEDVEATFSGFTERAIERAAVANGISREAVRFVLEEIR